MRPSSDLSLNASDRFRENMHPRTPEDLEIGGMTEREGPREKRNRDPIDMDGGDGRHKEENKKNKHFFIFQLFSTFFFFFEGLEDANTLRTLKLETQEKRQ